MRVDFHCHTKATKSGDGNRTVEPAMFAQKLKQADVDAVAITNHNHFDKEQYVSLSAAVADQIMVWPGVELDVAGAAGRWHMIVIVGPNKVDDFDAVIAGLVDNRSADDCIWPFEELWEVFNGWEAIFLSHCHDKDPAISQADIENVRNIAGDDWRIFFEPKSLVTLGIWSNHGFGMLIGSDVKNWDKYEECRFSNLRLPVDSFEQLCLLARRDAQVVETLLSRKPITEMTALPHPSISLKLPIRQDINVIFGQKGTGKTEIIKSLCSEYERLGMPYSCYIGGEKYSEFERLLEANPIERSTKDFDRDDCSEEIAFILNWAESLPTSISQYVSWCSTIGNSEKKDRFKLSDQQMLPSVSREPFERDKTARSVVGSFTKTYSEKALGSYLNSEDETTFSELLITLENSIALRAREHYIGSASAKMANDALAVLKDIIDSKSNTKSKPGTAGFLALVENRMMLYKKTKRILAQLESKELVTKEYLGCLEDKGRLFLVTRKRYLCSSSTTKEFGVGINKLKAVRNALEGIIDSIASADLPEAVANFARAFQESGIQGLDAFIGVEKYVALEGCDDEYKPSDGEKGILVIERKLRIEADVYLLDEPELGMSNYYIDTVIRPIVQDRARAGKTVIISTHNANLAVRTLPYVSIYREHVAGTEFRTYFGNPFINKLVDQSDPENEKDWSETSMLTLEGGPDAFYDRKRIYEAGKHER